MDRPPRFLGLSAVVAERLRAMPGVHQVEDGSLGWRADERCDLLVEGGKDDVAVDFGRRLLGIEDPNAAHDSGARVPDDVNAREMWIHRHEIVGEI